MRFLFFLFIFHNKNYNRKFSIGLLLATFSAKPTNLLSRINAILCELFVGLLNKGHLSRVDLLISENFYKFAHKFFIYNVKRTERLWIFVLFSFLTEKLFFYITRFAPSCWMDAPKREIGIYFISSHCCRLEYMNDGNA